MVLTQRNLAAFAAGYQAYNELSRRYEAAKEAGSILRQRYNRYYYTGSLSKKYSKPLGASNTTSLARSVRGKTVRRMPMRYSKRPRSMMRRRRVYRRRYVSKKTRWQSKARRQVGAPKNYSSTKTTESVVPGTVTQTPTKFVSGRPLILINSTTINNVNSRQRYMCNISGIKLDATFQNLLPVRVYINWAVVHGKQGQVVNDTTPDFFRDYTTVRAFDANATATKTGLTYSVAQINTDEFVVLKRGKFLLAPGIGGSTQQQGVFNYGAGSKEISHYLKLGRAFYFDDGGDVPQDQIYFVCWCSNPTEALGTTNDAYNYRLRSIIYWREPKSG